ncbi:MAG: GDSL-type esterase/lipase family protein [Verrucomicrobiia bacterium]|jgi:tetratricopeptide (TPR) repeat protein
MRLRDRLNNSNLAKFLLIFFSVVAGLLLCEGLVRGFQMVPPVQALWVEDDEAIYMRSTNARLGHVLRPGGTLDHKYGRATINSHGLRDREREISKPPGTRRILVLGDSVVEGITYVPDDKTLTRQWEAFYPDGKTEVLNLGVSGYCTRAEVELLETVGLKFQPDVVVVVFVLNDFHNFNREHTVEGGVVDRPQWSKHLFIGSQLFRLLSLRFNWFEFTTETDPMRWNHAAIGGNNVTAGLHRLRELANRLGFKVLVVAWPEFQNGQIVDKRTMPDNPNELVIGRLAEMNGFPFLRASTGFAQQLASRNTPISPRLDYTSDGDRMHPNAEGSRIAAEFLKAAVDRGLPAPPYQLRPTDLTATRAAASWGENHAAQTQSILNRRVAALMIQGRIPKAEAYLKEILARNPNQRAANIAMGGLLIDDKRPGEAIPYMEKVVAIEPENPENWVVLAVGHAGVTNQAAALTVLQDGLKRHPDSANLHFNIGYLLSLRDPPQAALPHLRKALKIDPTFPHAETLLRGVEQTLAQPQAEP